MQTLKITKIETANGVKGNKPWTRTDITGVNAKSGNEVTASTFDGSELSIGDTIEADIVVSGQYSKLKTFRKVGQGQQSATPLQSPRTQNQAGNQSNPSRTTTQAQTAPISGAEKGMIIGKSIDCFCAGLFTIGTQPELWEYIKGEISRVTGVRVN